MKCIINTDTGEIVRVKDDEAFKMVNTKKSIYRYCARWEWKAQENNK